ncbi:MAG TPA: hypothetical protein VGE74_28215 [Gemmata sp.]
MATPLPNLQAAYASACAKLADALANPQPSYSEKGRSVSWDEYRAGLLKQIQDLAKIPGVAPELSPVFDVLG